MSSDQLWLNPSKAQYIWLDTRKARSNIDESTIWFVIHNLGLLLDEALTMADKVNFLYQLRQTRVIRHNLSVSTAVILMHSLILTLLDYCNSALADLTGFCLRQLQSILHCAA